VALDESGRPDFNLLQHYRAEASRIHYFVFDLLVYNNRDIAQLPLIERHQIMKSVLRLHSPLIRIAEYFEVSAGDILSAARAHGLEGVVAKRKDSRYEVGKRSGSWAKYRLNSGQELVIGQSDGSHSALHCTRLGKAVVRHRESSSERRGAL
jgi:ATP-dependent DNA ligase